MEEGAWDPLEAFPPPPEGVLDAERPPEAAEGAPAEGEALCLAEEEAVALPELAGSGEAVRIEVVAARAPAAAGDGGAFGF